MNQAFTCERCRKTSSVRIRKHEDAWSVYVKIVNKHSTISPKCEAGANEIRAHSQLGIIKAAKGRKATA